MVSNTIITYDNNMFKAKKEKSLVPDLAII